MNYFLERYADFATGRGFGQVQMVTHKPRGWINDPNFRRTRNELTNQEFHESIPDSIERHVSFAKSTNFDVRYLINHYFIYLFALTY